MDALVASYATIEKVNVRSDKSGVDLDLTLQPTGKKSNARLGFAYEGSGFGLFVLPEVGDEVFVVFPGGDVNAGCVVSRMPNTIDSIPENVDHTRILLVGKSGHKLDATINANCDIQVNGNTNISSSGTTNVTSDGNCTVESTGGTTEVKSVSTVLLSAPEVKGGNGTAKRLANIDLKSWLESHTHSGGSTPDQSVPDGDFTSELKGA